MTYLLQQARRALDGAALFARTHTRAAAVAAAAAAAAAVAAARAAARNSRVVLLRDSCRHGGDGDGTASASCCCAVLLRHKPRNKSLLEFEFDGRLKPAPYGSVEGVLRAVKPYAVLTRKAE